MSRQLKPYICRLRDELQRHGLYHERNESLIKSVALAELILDNYQQDLKGHRALLEQTGSMGQTKINLNPIYVEARKLLAVSINGKAKLGMGNLGKNMDDRVDKTFSAWMSDVMDE